MVQPDARLFPPVMGLRAAMIAVMFVAYSIAWVAAPEDTQFAFISAILLGEAVLSGAIYVAFNRRHDALLIHLSLLTDTLATTGLVMCTEYAGSPFQLFYVLIVVAAGLLYDRTTGIYYLLIVSFANVAVLVHDLVNPLFGHEVAPSGPAYAIVVIMGAALPLISFIMLLVVKLTQHARYSQTLYDNVSDGMLILDETGTVVDANVGATRLTCRSRHELVGARIESLAATAEWAELLSQQVRRCVGGATVALEIPLTRKGAEPLPVEIRAQWVSGLTPGRILVLARDVSARRLMEAEIRRQNDELRRINQELQVGRDLALNASRLKSQFVANMSHELRTPLNSIIGYTQFVLEDAERPVAADQREDLGRVLRSARHLLDLINGVLDLARIESGRESVSISRFGLGDLVDSVVDAVSPMAKQKGLRLDCRVPDGLPDLQSDEKKLQQVLLNLLANAVKFTERGSVSVTCQRDGADLVRIVVRDTGIGIPPAHLDDIFNEFHQVDPSIHKHYGGTGLGLAIARRLVELLKGTVQAESVVGSGSTFTVTIPMTLVSTHDAAGKSTVVPMRSDGEPADAASDVDGPREALPEPAGPVLMEPKPGRSS